MQDHQLAFDPLQRYQSSNSYASQQQQSELVMGPKQLQHTAPPGYFSQYLQHQVTAQQASAEQHCDAVTGRRDLPAVLSTQPSVAAHITALQASMCCQA